MLINKSSSLGAKIQPLAKMQVVTVKSSLTSKVTQDPNHSKTSMAGATTMAGTAGAATPPDLTSWSSGRPTAEYTATTGTVTASNASTITSGAIKLNLKKGASYNFSAGYSYQYSGSKPTVYMQITDANGKVVASGKSNSLAWVPAADGDYTITFGITPGKGGSAKFSNYKLDATQALSRIPTSSGDSNIDAVLAGGSNWWHPEGNIASKSTTNISASIKQLSGASNKVYYGFLGGTENYLSAKDKANFKEMDSAQRDAVKTAFNYLSTLINVTFELDETKSNIEFGTNNQTDSAGYANYPLGNGSNPSVLLLDNSENTANNGENLAKVGGYGWQTLIHEIGHAMGLKHPGAYNAGGGTTPKPYLPTAMDNRSMSIMSYNDPTSSNILSLTKTDNSYRYNLAVSNPATYQTYDIAALQYLYGANTSTKVEEITVTNNYAEFKTIWAPQAGGVALNASSTTRSNIFDLRQGGYSSISMRLTDAEKTEEIKNKFISDLNFSESNATSAANSLYKSLKASKNQKKVTLDKTLYDGKNNLSLSYGSSFSSVTGGTKADKFYASTYSTIIDGKEGADTVFLQGTAKDWVIETDKSKATSKSGAVITLRNIEAIAFYKATESLVRS